MVFGDHEGNKGEESRKKCNVFYLIQPLPLLLFRYY